MDSHESSAPAKRRRSPYRTLSLALLVALVTVLLGGVGGVGGFVLLSHSDSRPVVWLRGVLHIDSQGVTIPVHQAVTLQESSAIIDAARKVSPAVVSVATAAQVNAFYDAAATPSASGGSGFILTSDGLIATTKRLAAQSGLKVVLGDGRIFDAKLQALDPLSDLALIKIEAKDLPVVELGTSTDLETGQAVMTLGNPLSSFSDPLTFGVLTGTGHAASAGATAGTASERFVDYLQTDAAVGPTNDGGPLLNIAGQVVGLTTDTLPVGGASGSGYALPIDSLKPVIDGYRRTGLITRLGLGISYEPVTNELQQLQNLSVNYGLLVTAAPKAGGPADVAGVKQGDVITELNGERIDSAPMDSLNDRLTRYKSGDSVQLRVLRDGAYQSLKATVAALQ